MNRIGKRIFFSRHYSSLFKKNFGKKCSTHKEKYFVYKRQAYNFDVECNIPITSELSEHGDIYKTFAESIHPILRMCSFYKHCCERQSVDVHRKNFKSMLEIYFQTSSWDSLEPYEMEYLSTIELNNMMEWIFSCMNLVLEEDDNDKWRNYYCRGVDKIGILFQSYNFIDSESLERLRSSKLNPAIEYRIKRQENRLTELKPEFISDLDSQIHSYYEDTAPDDERLQLQERVRLRLDALVKQYNETYDVKLFGSSASLLGSKTSDIDLCIVTYSPNVRIHNPKTILRAVSEGLLSSSSYDNIYAILKAQVPVLKFKDKESGIDGDVVINNTVAIDNTALIRSYVEYDPRVRPLLFAIKRWATVSQMNSAFAKFMSPYGYTLLALHYLQVCDPPILPNLQEDIESITRTDYLNYDTRFHKYRPLKPGTKKNTKTVAELLFGFFRFYAFEWKYHSDVASIRDGKPESKVGTWGFELDSRRRHLCWEGYISVRDPFEYGRDLGKYFNHRSQSYFHYMLKDTYKLMRDEGRMKMFEDVDSKKDK